MFALTADDNSVIACTANPVDCITAGIRLEERSCKGRFGKNALSQGAWPFTSAARPVAKMKGFSGERVSIAFAQ